MAGLYVHIPVCRRKCLYCDFFSVGERQVAWPQLVDALLQEASARNAEPTEDISTFYLGGGTPSLMPIEELQRLVKGLKGIFTERWKPTELTIEINPDDVNPEKALCWRELGLNRASLGIQSLNDAELQRVGRRHTAAQELSAFHTLRKVGFDNISVDLIFGLPEQSLLSWETTLHEALALGPEHLSAYSLMYEPGTPLTRSLERGLMKETDESLYLQMFQHLNEAAKRAGMRRYEISNFCRPGFQSCHNSSYWKSQPYLGLGPGACSFDGCKTRRSNRCDIKAYLANPSQSFEIEHLNETERTEERILTELRTAEGLELKNLSDDAVRKVVRNAAPFIEEGRLSYDGNRLRLTEDGIMTSDSIILALADF